LIRPIHWPEGHEEEEEEEEVGLVRSSREPRGSGDA